MGKKGKEDGNQGWTKKVRGMGVKEMLKQN
jgi:hypothetical protein